MTSFGLLLVASLALFMTSVRGQSVDTTVVPNTGGSPVVNAVVDLLRATCIFPNDRLFLRRVAYVETVDGTVSTTYRDGYDGGIWKVDQNMFNPTTSCLGVLRETCDIIKQEFNIDWTRVQWSDLRKPLYSGLAAALYLIQRTNGNMALIPADIPGQADFWARVYDTQGYRANYTLKAADATKFDCNKAADIAFIIDSSGSINDPDFNLSIQFVANVVSAMNIGPAAVRVASIMFASSPYINFYLDTYNTKDEVLAAIRSIRRTTGGTNTGLALDMARTHFFSGTARGARVGVLVTDGQSDSHTNTALAAEKLKSENGVVMFAIGVGGYNLLELNDVASDPNCTHVYTLTNFAQMDTILYEIQKSTCEAPIRMPTASNGTGTVVMTRLTDNITTIAVGLPRNNNTNNTDVSGPATVTVNVSCGILEIYVSYTNPNPGPAFYSEKLTATDDHAAHLTTSITEGGRQLYMTVIGTKLPDSVALLRNCSDFHYNVSVVDKDFLVRCCRGSDCQPCTGEQLKQEPGIRQLICTNYYEEFPNPCTAQALLEGRYMFQYPYDQNKFIRCDYKGNPYVTLCPNRQTFDPATHTCGYNTPGSGDKSRLPSGYPNPCTLEHIQALYLFFEYPPDRQKFIHCDLWGDAWLQSCPALQVWNQHDQSCETDTPVAQPSGSTTTTPLANPCTAEAFAAGKQFFPHPCDHTRFIHCGPSGTMWVQNCPAGMFYHPFAMVCVLGDPQSTPEC